MTLKTFLLTALCTFCVCGMQAQSLNYKIEGNVNGLTDGTELVLIPVSTFEQKAIGTATVSGGRFSFSGTVSEPTAVYMMVKGAYGSTGLVLGDGTGITLTGTVTRENMSNNTSYDFRGVRAEGSAWTDLYRQILGVRDYLNILYESNNEVFKEFHEEFGKARTAGNNAAMDSLNNSPLGRACNLADKLFFKTCEESYHKAVTDNKDSFLGPLAMVSLFSYLTPEQKSWYDELSDGAKNSQYGRMVKEDVAPETAVGRKAPALSVKDEKGRTLTLKDLAKGKKYVLVDFWASWCKPCRKEIPNVKAQYARYKNKGFEVVSISIDKKDADWRKALKEEQLAWPNFRDADGSVSTLWEVKFVPTMYLLSADGTIVAENARGEALAKKLAELFGK